MGLFKYYVYSLFPLPLLLLTLLILPLPGPLLRPLLTITDSVLFLKPHPQLHVSLFAIALCISLYLLYKNYVSMLAYSSTYKSVKLRGGDSSKALVSLLAAERNIWISGCGTALWVVLFRYRTLMKRVAKAEAEVASS